MVSYGAFDGLLKNITQRQHDILVMPNHFSPFLEQVGFQQRLTGFSLDGLIIARRDSNLTQLSHLTGRVIHLNDELSLATAMFYQVTEKEGLGINDYTIKFGGQFDTLIFKLINGEADVTFTLDMIYNRLSEKFKERLIVLHRVPMVSAVSILFDDRMPGSYINKITAAFGNLEKWHVRKSPKIPLRREVEEKIMKELNIVGVQRQ